MKDIRKEELIAPTGEVAVHKAMKNTEHNSTRYDCCWSSKHPHGQCFCEWLCITAVKQPWFKFQCFPSPPREKRQIRPRVVFLLISLYIYQSLSVLSSLLSDLSFCFVTQISTVWETPFICRAHINLFPAKYLKKLHYFFLTWINIITVKLLWITV